MNEILRTLLICLISFFCSAVGLEIIVIIFIVANDLFSRKNHSENDEKYKSKRFHRQKKESEDNAKGL